MGHMKAHEVDKGTASFSGRAECTSNMLHLVYKMFAIFLDSCYFMIVHYKILKCNNQFYEGIV